MKIRNILAAMLIFCMVLTLCACGNEPVSNDTNATTEASGATTETTEKVDDGKVNYKVTVVDQDGNPVAGAMVQMCLETCFPGLTNENGVAEFSLVEADYKVSFVSVPEGYTADAENYYFEGATELTIVLNAAA